MLVALLSIAGNLILSILKQIHLFYCLYNLFILQPEEVAMVTKDVWIRLRGYHSCSNRRVIRPNVYGWISKFKTFTKQLHKNLRANYKMTSVGMATFFFIRSGSLRSCTVDIFKFWEILIPGELCWGKPWWTIQSTTKGRLTGERSKMEFIDIVFETGHDLLVLCFQAVQRYLLFTTATFLPFQFFTEIAAYLQNRHHHLWTFRMKWKEFVM